jgi:hypothetical protein
MLKYGDQEISLNDQSPPCTVSEFIVEDLSQDELSFSDTGCQKIYETIVQGIAEQIIYTSNYFLRVQDTEMVQFTSLLIGFEEELSESWVLKYKIYTKHESNDLGNTLMQTLYNFKKAKIGELIAAIQRQMQQVGLVEEEILTLLSKQMVYERVKQQLSTRNGRIILK